MNRYEETFDENNGESSGPKIIDRQIGVLRAQKEYEEISQRTSSEVYAKKSAQRQQQVEQRNAEAQAHAAKVNADLQERVDKFRRLEDLLEEKREAADSFERDVQRFENSVQVLSTGYDKNLAVLQQQKAELEKVDPGKLDASVDEAIELWIAEKQALEQKRRPFQATLDENKKIETELADVEANIAALEREAAEEERKNEEVLRETAEMDAEIEQLQAEATKASEEVDNLTDQLSAFEAHVLKDRTVLAAKEREAAEKQAELDALQLRLKDFDEEEARLKEEVAAAREEIEAERDKCEGLKDELAKAALENEKIAAQLTIAQKEMEMREQLRAAAEQQRISKQEAQNALKIHIEHLEAQLAYETQQLDELVASVKAVEDDIAAMQAAEPHDVDDSTTVRADEGYFTEFMPVNGTACAPPNFSPGGGFLG